MAVNHAVTIASANNAPNPTGTPVDPSQHNPTPDNMWNCAYLCTIPGHTDIVLLTWDGTYFGLPDSEANDNNFGTVSFTYNPPLV